MAAVRKVVELSITEVEQVELQSIARSRTEPASRVERARILLHYRDDPSSYGVGIAVGVTHQTVQRCLARASRFGVMAALDDSPRPGKEPEITLEARAWLVSLACQQAKDVGYPHELWTTRLLARHAREHAPNAGHVCLARIAQGTVCKILAEQEVKPHKVRYYLERRDPAFEAKMAEVLCVYQEVAILRAVESDAVTACAESDPGTANKTVEKPAPNVAFISYDEKPGIQAIANTAPDLPPVANEHPCVARDHEYKRHGTLSLLAGIDLLTGQVHACVENRHRSREFIGFLKKLDAAYPSDTRRLHCILCSGTRNGMLTWLVLRARQSLAHPGRRHEEGGRNRRRVEAQDGSLPLRHGNRRCKVRKSRTVTIFVPSWSLRPSRSRLSPVTRKSAEPATASASR
jgi:hypothetical protein